MFARLMAYCKTCGYRKDASDSHEAYDYLEQHLAENPAHDSSVEARTEDNQALPPEAGVLVRGGGEIRLRFDEEYQSLTNYRALEGKTIARIVPIVVSHYRPIDGEREPDGWRITFTDGDRLDLIARYRDSSVLMRRPDEASVELTSAR